MNIYVCFKIVPDYEQIVEADWENIEAGPDDSYVKRMISCFDESALETALRMRDSYGDDQCCVKAVTVGERLADNFVKNLYAVGISEVIHIRAAAHDTAFHPEYVADRLMDFLSGNDADMILTGRQAGPGDSGCVPYFLAEQLGWPVISEVYDFQIAARQKGIIVRHLAGDMMEASLITGPAVLSIGNCEHAYLRMATLKERLAVKGRSCTCIEAEPDREKNRYKAKSLRYPNKDRKCRIQETDHSEAAAMWLWNVVKEEREDS